MSGMSSTVQEIALALHLVFDWQHTTWPEKRAAGHISQTHSDTSPQLEGGHPETSGGPLGQPWQTF